MTFTHVLKAVVRAALLVVTTLATAQEAAQTKLPTVTLSAGFRNIVAEVARTSDEHATGLMFRTVMGANEGMLFVFPESAQQCFWMKNTLLPLSAAFIADDGAIVNVADMQPKSLDSHCSDKPVRYVLEMHQGWFARQGLKAGSRLQGGPFRH
jgi:uncharacterized membrane protein (UPF0127 family)